MLTLLAPLLLQIAPAEVFISEETLAPVVVEELQPSYEVVAAGSRLVAANPSSVGEQLILFGYSQDGVLEWERSVPLPPEAEFQDLEISEDGQTVFLLLSEDGFTIGVGNHPELNAFGFDAHTGGELWTHTLPNFGGVLGGSEIDGALDYAAGRLALLANIPGDFSTGDQHRVQVLDAASGAVLSTGAVQPEEMDGIAISPAGNFLATWRNNWTLHCYSATDAASLWMKSIPTTQVAPNHSGEVNAVLFDESETRIIRCEEVAVRALSTASGNTLWLSEVLDAKEAVNYGPDRVFVCGRTNVGLDPGDSYRWALLDTTDGSEVWSGQTPALAPYTPIFEGNGPHAAVDLARERIAFRDRGLYVVDAASGSLVGTGSFASALGGDRGLFALANGHWLGRVNVNPWSAQEDFVWVLDSDGALVWGDAWLEPTPYDAFPLTMEVRGEASQIHLMHGYGGVVAPTEGFYQVRDSKGLRVLAEWPASFPVQTGKWETGPLGQRVLSIQEGTFSSGWELFDAWNGEALASGSLLGVSASSYTEAAWSSSGDFAIARVADMDLFIARYDSAGTEIWNLNHNALPGTSKRHLGLHWDSESGDLVAAYSAFGAKESAYMVRFDPGSGQVRDIAGFNFWDWDPEVSFGSSVDEVLAIETDSAANRTYFILEGRSSFVDDSVWGIVVDNEDWSVLDAKLLLSAHQIHDYSPNGVAFSPEAGTALVTGVAWSDMDGPPSEIRTDLFELPSFATMATVYRPTVTLPAASEGLYLSEGVAAIRHGTSLDEAWPEWTMELLDVASGESLASLESDAEVASDSPWAALPAESGWSALLFGRLDAGDANSVVQTIGVAPLLGTPDSMEGAGGAVLFALRAGPQHAGKSFQLLGSLTGWDQPGVFGGAEVPLTFDTYTRSTLIFAGAGPWVGSAGVLDADGAGTAFLDLPDVFPAGSGVTAYHAALVFGANGEVDFVSQPVQLTQE